MTVRVGDTRRLRLLLGPLQMTASFVLLGGTLRLLAVMDPMIARLATLVDTVSRGLLHLSAQERVRVVGTRCQTRPRVRQQITASLALLVGMA